MTSHVAHPKEKKICKANNRRIEAKKNEINGASVHSSLPRLDDVINKFRSAEVRRIITHTHSISSRFFYIIYPPLFYFIFYALGPLPLRRIYVHSSKQTGEKERRFFNSQAGRAYMLFYPGIFKRSNAP
jgi:hypothetical protein